MLATSGADKGRVPGACHQIHHDQDNVSGCSAISLEYNNNSGQPFNLCEVTWSLFQEHTWVCRGRQAGFRAAQQTKHVSLACLLL